MKHPHCRESEKILILDVETNGKHPCDSILTLSALMHDYESGELIDEIDLQFRPVGEWNPEAETIHKIPLRRAMQFDDPDQSLKLFDQWCEHHSKNKLMALGHHSLNIGGYFDWGVLFYTYMKHLSIDVFYKRFSHSESTIDFLREAVKQCHIAPIKSRDKAGRMRDSYKLNLWANRFNIELDHHDAKSDALACSTIYWKLRQI